MSDEQLKSVKQPTGADRRGPMGPDGRPQAGGAPLLHGTDGRLSDGLSPRLSSRQLFGLHNELLIEHAGFIYRLRITQANKLILTK